VELLIFPLAKIVAEKQKLARQVKTGMKCFQENDLAKREEF